MIADVARRRIRACWAAPLAARAWVRPAQKAAQVPAHLRQRVASAQVVLTVLRRPVHRLPVLLLDGSDQPRGELIQRRGPEVLWRPMSGARAGIALAAHRRGLLPKLPGPRGPPRPPRPRRPRARPTTTQGQR